MDKVGKSTILKAKKLKRKVFLRGQAYLRGNTKAVRRTPKKSLIYRGGENGGHPERGQEKIKNWGCAQTGE